MSKLEDAVVGSYAVVRTIQWVDDDGVAVDLTDADVSGILQNFYTRVSKSIAGALALVSGQETNGQFTWTMVAGDVDSGGLFRVQFTATYPGSKPNISFSTWLTIRDKITV